MLVEEANNVGLKTALKTGGSVYKPGPLASINELYEHLLHKRRILNQWYG